MRRIATLMLSLAFLGANVMTTFAQEQKTEQKTEKKIEKKKKTPKKKKGEKKEEKKGA